MNIENSINELDCNRWLNEIKKYTGHSSDVLCLKFCLSYTLQSLRYGEDFNRFKWKE